MKSAFLVLAALALLASTSVNAHAHQSTPAAEACQGFDQYADEMLSAQAAFWTSLREAGLGDRVQATLTELEWAELARLLGDLRTDIGQIPPPLEVAIWHQYQVEALDLQSTFAQAAAVEGYQDAIEQFRDESETIEANERFERDQALGTCSEFTAFYKEWTGLSQPAELLHRRILDALENHGLSVDPEADTLLLEITRHAAERISSEPDQIESWQLTTDAVTVFVDALAEEATLNGDGVVHEQGIRDVLDHLCPIWPIC